MTRRSRTPMVALAVLMIALPGTAAPLGAVICIENNGEKALETGGCVCNDSERAESSSLSSTEYHELKAAHNQEGCGACVDLPVGKSTDHFRARTDRPNQVRSLACTADASGSPFHRASLQRASTSTVVVQESIFGDRFALALRI